jgi:hypothetical protein
VVAGQNTGQKAGKQAGADDGDVELSHLAALRQSAPAAGERAAAYFARMSL